MRKAAVFPLETGSIEPVTVFVQNCLTEMGAESAEVIKGTLVAEEAVGSLITHAEGTGEIRIAIRRLLGDLIVEMSCPGREYSLSRHMEASGKPLDEEVGPQAQERIRNILLSSLAKDLKYRHKEDINYIRMTVVKSKKAFLYKTLLSLFAALVLGLLLSAFAPENLNRGLDTYLLSPIKTVYINLLKMVVAPVVFFSIVSCIAGFSNFSELGKIGGRTIMLYTLTTILAVMVGILSFYLFQPGHTALALPESSGAAAAVSATFSIKEMLVGMAPSYFVKPFLNDDMPQLIFLAVLCGIATGLIGQYSTVLVSLFQALSELFMKIAAMIIRFMPLAVFCSAASMILNLGIQTIASLVGMFATFVFGLVVMMLIYCLLLILFARLDPRPLIRKYAPVMLQVFSMASSNAAIPINMEACEKKLGISRKVFSLSIPLGSTLNLDGTCIQLAVFSLALAKVYGVSVSGGSLLTMAIMIVILSMGAPGMPGAGVICMSVLLGLLHVPTEAVGLVMGIAPILGMFLCMSNCVGDVIVTTIVAKSAGELDMEVYKA